MGFLWPLLPATSLKSGEAPAKINPKFNKVPNSQPQEILLLDLADILHCLNVLSPAIWTNRFAYFWINFSKYYWPLGSWSADILWDSNKFLPNQGWENNVTTADTWWIPGSRTDRGNQNLFQVPLAYLSVGEFYVTVDWPEIGRFCNRHHVFGNVQYFIFWHFASLLSAVRWRCQILIFRKIVKLKDRHHS